MKTLILNRKEIIKLVDVRQAIRSVEEAFRECARHKTQMPAKVYLDLAKYKGDFRAMPAYVAKSNACVLKWVNVHRDNPKKGLPTVMAVMILSDPKTGFPLAIMDGTYATGLRTAAAGAVAAKYLANKDSCCVGLLGCGVQARMQLTALRTMFKIKQVNVWGHKSAIVRNFLDDMQNKNEGMRGVTKPEECVGGADILVTTTPSRKPLVKRGWLKQGVHINAIGADAPGKQELDLDILKHARIIIDDWEQSSHGGEINVAVRRKIISKRNICANIGEIVLGIKNGRLKKKDITVFDSTGLAIQDAAVANLLYKVAVRKRAGKKVSLVL